jgi:hypothetical protein
MIWTNKHVLSCGFENNPNNANGDSFTEVGSVAYADGVFGRQIDFLGQPSYLDLGESEYIGTRIDGASAITIDLIVTPASLSIARQELLYGNIGNQSGSRVVGTIINIENDDQFRVGIRSRDSDSLQNHFATGVFQVGQPSHLTVIVDYAEKEIVVFFNGEFHSSTTGLSFGSNFYNHRAVTGTQRNDTIAIDPPANTARQFTGKLDELNIWRGRLAPSDIKRLQHNFHPISI